jgi:RNA polymerase sigma-70 factor (ECF subfamily)
MEPSARQPLTTDRPAPDAGLSCVWENLLTRFAAGDGDALGELFELLFDDLVEQVQRDTKRDEAFAADAVQDAFVKAIRGIPIMQHETEVRAWFRRVALRSAIDRIRAEKRRDRRERASATEAPSSTVARTGEELDGLYARLQALDQDAAKLVDARIRFGWTLDRIGRSLGLRPGAVDGRLRRIFTQLRDAEDQS